MSDLLSYTSGSLVAGITVLWALAAALVPPMQKGNDTARSLHIALNTVNLLLFVWQIPTGWEIVLKVLEFTKFPWFASPASSRVEHCTHRVTVFEQLLPDSLASDIFQRLAE
jgi:hypothetical protein